MFVKRSGSFEKALDIAPEMKTTLVLWAILSAEAVPRLGVCYSLFDDNEPIFTKKKPGKWAGPCRYRIEDEVYDSRNAYM